MNQLKQMFFVFIIGWISPLSLVLAKQSVYIDPSIEHSFSINSRDAQKVRVIITSSILSPMTADLSSLKANNRVFENRIRKLLVTSSEEIEPLWSSHSVVTSISERELELLKTDPSIAGVYFALKKIRWSPLVNPKPKIERENFSNTAMTYGLAKIGVRKLRAEFPELDGQGVRVGIIDTGIDDQHPDLKGKLFRYKNFSPEKSERPGDGFGHGTHVAGTIAGENKSGEWIGVAPKVQLIVARIFDGNGESTREGILKSMQWMLDPDGDPNTNDAPQVINNSWSDDEPFNDRDPEQEPLCIALSSWKQNNIVPVFSAGNRGPKEGTINIPGACPDAFSVAATEQSDRSPWFSSAGPAVWKSVQLVKPDISAPGMNIKSSYPRNDYEVMSGTSMSTPHVTGAIAILLQASSQLKVPEVIQLMERGAKDLGSAGKDFTFGVGRIDIYETIRASKQK